MALPVVLHENAAGIRVPVEADAHQVPGLAFVPVRRRPHGDQARHHLAVVDPRLQAHARGALSEREQVVADREALRLRLGKTLESLRRRLVDVATAGGGEVAGDTLAAPAEVIRRGDVGKEVEAQLATEMARRLDQPRRVDDERRLAMRLANLDQPRGALEVQEATPRSSYAGGTPAMTFSCRRTMPSISASGRGGHPGT
jgi:hypothetical protein